MYHMCTSWQWPASMLWILMMPFLIRHNYWFGALGETAGVVVYLLPSIVWSSVSATAASLETRHTYHERLTSIRFLKRIGRLLPHIVISAGMLPHQFSAFMEGLFGSLSSEFERTPKAASVTGMAVQSSAVKKRYPIKIHWPYVLGELFYIVFQLAWAVWFFEAGMIWQGSAAAGLAACVIYVACFYGDHLGRLCFVINREWLAVGYWTRHAAGVAQSIFPSRQEKAEV